MAEATALVVATPPTVKSPISATVASSMFSENVTSTVVVDVVTAESIVGATPSVMFGEAPVVSSLSNVSSKLPPPDV